MNVYTDVVCDMFHSGHVNFFKTIKERYPNCRLVVGVMSDEQCAAYKRVPIYAAEDRCSILSSIRYVDEVIKDAEMPVSEAFIAENGIDVVVHADDISAETESRWYEAAIRLKKYATIPYTSRISTTKIIERVRNSGK